MSPSTPTQEFLTPTQGVETPDHRPCPLTPDPCPTQASVLLMKRVLLLLNNIIFDSFVISLPCSLGAQELVGEAVINQIHHRKYHCKNDILQWTYAFNIFSQTQGIR